MSEKRRSGRIAVAVAAATLAVPELSTPFVQVARVPGGSAPRPAGSENGSAMKAVLSSASNRLSKTAAAIGGAVGVASVTGRRSVASEAEVASANAKVEKLIKQYPVIVFSKTTCPYCTRAKHVLTEEGAKFHVVELDKLPGNECESMQEAFLSMTGARTVPRVFVKGQCVGGCDDVVALQDAGTLSEVLGIRKDTTPEGFKIKKSEGQWKAELGEEAYYILRKAGTEAPHSHKFNKVFPTQGHFACAACSLPLYSATSKFKSSCGWPVYKECYFSEEAGGCHVLARNDFQGVEIVCKRCESHLGHVFFDAQSPSNANGERH